MQKDHQEIQGNYRVRSVQGSEIRRKNVSNVANTTFSNIATCSRQRVSMARPEFQQPRTLFQKKNNSTSRYSILPSQILESSKEVDVRSKDMELKFLYNEYLQAIMVEHITKMKSEEMKNTIIRQLATIDKECAQAEDKLLKLKIREKDIMQLSTAQTELDTQIREINEYFGSDKIDTLKKIISHLNSVLEPLDQLRCNNVILPEKPEEWLELRKAFKECGDTLERIGKLINTNAETYKAVYSGIKDFTTIYNDIESYQKKFDEALTNLQVLVLKSGLFL